MNEVVMTLFQEFNYTKIHFSSVWNKKNYNQKRIFRFPDIIPKTMKH